MQPVSARVGNDLAGITLVGCLFHFSSRPDCRVGLPEIEPCSLNQTVTPVKLQALYNENPVAQSRLIFAPFSLGPRSADNAIQ